MYSSSKCKTFYTVQGSILTDEERDNLDKQETDNIKSLKAKGLHRRYAGQPLYNCMGPCGHRANSPSAVSGVTFFEFLFVIPALG